MQQEAHLGAQSETFAGDLTGMFDFLIDPVAAARHLPRKYFWIGPLLLVSIVVFVVGLLNLPIVQQVLLNQPVPPNVTPEQFQQRINVGLTIQRVFMYLSPLVVAIVLALSALVVHVTSMALGVKTRFLELFNLLAGVGIIDALKAIVTTVIIHMKGEASSMADLQPALGLDILAPVGANKVLVAFLGFFNVFGIWAIVMTILIFAAGYRVSKGKATIAVLPLFLIGLVFRLIGAFFAPSS